MLPGLQTIRERLSNSQNMFYLPMLSTLGSSKRASSASRPAVYRATGCGRAPFVTVTDAPAHLRTHEAGQQCYQAAGNAKVKFWTA